jgi:hypothetical protein
MAFLLFWCSRFRIYSSDCNATILGKPIHFANCAVSTDREKPQFSALADPIVPNDFAVVISTVAARCLPRIINCEHKHLAYPDQMGCRELMSAHGYAFASSANDTLAYRLRMT